MSQEQEFSSAGLSQDPELLGDFILESREHLASIERLVLEIERDGTNREPLDGAFRAFHTIKGLAGFLEFGTIHVIAHEIETVLDAARNGGLSVTPAVVDVVLETRDHMWNWLAELESCADAGTPCQDGTNAALIDRIRAIHRPPDPVELADTAASLAALSIAQSVEAFPEPLCSAESAGTVAEESNQKVRANGVEARAVRVDTGKLDHLVDMVGEMVIAESMIRHDPEIATLNLPRLSRNLAELARITLDVQKTAMSMRMTPIAPLFRRMKRLVRDLSRKTGKLADLELRGEDTELDRNIVEEIADPLLHMLRNSIDHGIEDPDVRASMGKDPTGKLRLAARHEAGHIVIEVSDDGAGLDRDRILAKARERRIIGENDNLPDHDIFNLIFEPGFSTAREVTGVSGRGVGMDIVRKQILKLRGRIEIESRPGEGSTFFLKVPLTLAIIDGLVVSVGAERYIVPLFAVREMLRPAADAIFTIQNRSEMAMVRGRLLPLVRLHRVFDVQPKSTEPVNALLIVAESDDRLFCVMVDELLGKQEVVIKNLGSMFEGVRGLAGGAILGDGRVGLILDLDGVFAQSSAAV